MKTVFFIFCLMVAVSSSVPSARLKRGIYSLGHGYGGYSLGSGGYALGHGYHPYSLGHGYSGYPISSSLSYSPYIKASPIVSSYVASPVIHAAPTITKYVTVPRYVSVPLTRYVAYRGTPKYYSQRSSGWW